MATQELSNQATFPGTLVGMTFKQSSVPDFAALLQSAKEELGLLRFKVFKGRFAQ
jgi:hypothetical protein